jgi:long-subunit acyl-CoA synthetase (AMP-forming)
VNTELPHYRRVRKHHVCEELLTIENGLLTATSKLKRSAIAAHFADAIAGMYA